MFMNAVMVSGDVQESVFYDQTTGAQKPQFVVNMTVLDADTDEKFECQVTEGFQLLEALKKAKNDGEPVDVLRQIADQLRAQLPPKFTPMQLQVLRFKGKQVAFIKLVCRLLSIGATA